jgi:hypothetical protein
MLQRDDIANTYTGAAISEYQHCISDLNISWMRSDEDRP